MIWFFSASLASLLLGLMLVNFFAPGAGLHLSVSNIDAGAASEVIGKTQSFSVQHFIEHLFPKSVFEALATNEILQIVVFSIFFGVALTQYGEKGDSIVKFLDNLSKVILIVVGYVMWFAPLGVFGGITAIIAAKGLGILKVYSDYMVSFYVGLALLWTLLLAVGYFILRKRLAPLLAHLKMPLMVAFSTTSSEAVFPKLTDELEKFGCRKKIVSFILPLGYSFNLDGTSIYMTMAAIFVAQASGVHLSIGQQLGLLAVLIYRILLATLHVDANSPVRLVLTERLSALVAAVSSAVMSRTAGAILAHTHTITVDANGDHTHSGGMPASGAPGIPGGNGGSPYNAGSTGNAGLHTHTASAATTGGSKNLAAGLMTKVYIAL